ncbi:MAG: glycosyltransferase [Acidimicrobiales bacterium]
MRIAIHLTPAKRSHERDLFTSLDDVELVFVGGDDDEASPDIALPVRRVPWLGSRDRWSAALAWLGGTRSVDIEADVLIAQEAYSVGSAQMAAMAQRLGAPLVVLVAEILERYPLYRLPPWRFFTNRVRNADAHFICLTDLARRHLIALGFDPDAITVVAPGVDTELFTPSATARPADRSVAFVGELRPDKGILDLVEAGDILAAQDRPILLRVVGQGPLEADLRERANDRPWLELAGRLPRDVVAERLRDCAAFCLPSKGRTMWAEQFGFALVEAMASGVPVVSTDCGAIPEVVPPWNALVTQGDPTALAAALDEAVGPAADDWGPRNRAWAESHFDLQTQSRLLHDTLERILTVERSNG